MASARAAASCPSARAASDSPCGGCSRDNMRRGSPTSKARHATAELRGPASTPPAVKTMLQYWHAFRSRSRIFFLLSARVWCGIRRYSSSRITLGIATRIRAACRIAPCSSSVRANALQHQHQRPSRSADVNRLIACIQHQHRSLHRRLAKYPGAQIDLVAWPLSVALRHAATRIPRVDCHSDLCFRIFPDCISKPSGSKSRHKIKSVQSGQLKTCRSTSQPSPLHPRQRSDPYLHRSGSPKHPGTLPCRRAAGVNVIDQQHLAPSDTCASPSPHRKGALQILPSILRTQAELARRIPRPPQRR